MGTGTEGLQTKRQETLEKWMCQGEQNELEAVLGQLQCEVHPFVSCFWPLEPFSGGGGLGHPANLPYVYVVCGPKWPLEPLEPGALQWGGGLGHPANLPYV